jgi:hypothetical protein
LQTIPNLYQNLAVYSERKGARPIGLRELKKLVADHFVGEETVMKAGGFVKAAAIIANSLPDNKQTRSGDLGELLATEYISAETDFVVPVKKLRWKSDRQMPMHGNDVIGVATTDSSVRILKCECKSRAKFGKTVVEEAAGSLDLHDGRPNPSTLAFLTKRLYEAGRDEEADLFRALQTSGAIRAKNVVHLIFALSGNDPSQFLASGPKPKQKNIIRNNAAIMITDHQAFVAEVYDAYGERS